MLSTLRELRALASDARSWIALGVLSLLVGLVGPFGTFAMPVPARLAYWAAVVFGTAIIGTVVASTLERQISHRAPKMLRAAIGGALAGIPIVLFVLAINAVVFGDVQPVGAATLAVYCMIIASAVTMLAALFARRSTPVAPVTDTPQLLSRLPHGQRGRLLHLAVSDHYVEVTTDRGNTLVLSRLSDAIREAAPVEGLQVHRSHWVALDAVLKPSRQSGRPALELTNGTIVPISRSYLPAAKAAGLIG
ncbi:LytTR family transcriptional regulator DNA-binding domain-containing protein [Devosia sp. 2618]|uniref:LytTR family DNA-binding domain-containing protein n=1 Tax=Devosia sp. 2618 TaxID=3156454 RepID=UPI003394DE55